MKALYTSALLPLLFALLSCSENRKGEISSAQIEAKILDYADVLNASQKENIFKIIESFEKESGSPIAIITLNTLNGEDIHSFSLRKAKEMGNDNTDQMVITVVTSNKEIHIATANRLDHVIKEDITHKLIKEDMAPRFRKNRYSSGIFVAVSKMKELVIENKGVIYTNDESMATR